MNLINQKEKDLIYCIACEKNSSHNNFESKSNLCKSTSWITDNSLDQYRILDIMRYNPLTPAEFSDELRRIHDKDGYSLFNEFLSVCLVAAFKCRIKDTCATEREISRDIYEF